MQAFRVALERLPRRLKWCQILVLGALCLSLTMVLAAWRLGGMGVRAQWTWPAVVWMVELVAAAVLLGMAGLILRTRSQALAIARSMTLELGRSEERYRAVVDNTPVMHWMSGVDKLCNDFNQGWLEFRGRTLEQEYGEGWVEGVHPDDMERCLKGYVGAFDARQPFSMEYRLRRHDGQYRWILDKGVPRFDSEGRFQGYLGSCLDITEQKLAEEALQAYTAQLSTIVGIQNELTTAELGLAEVRQRIVNRACELTTADGAVLALVEGERFMMHTGAGMMAEHVEMSLPFEGSLMGLCARTGQVQRCDDSHADARAHPVAKERFGARSFVHVPLWHEGKVVGVLSVVSRRKEAFTEKEVHALQLVAGFFSAAMSRAAESEARQGLLKQRTSQVDFLQTLIDAIPCPVFYKDVEGRYLDCNRLFADFVGLGKARIIGRTVHDVCTKEDAERHHAMDAALLREPELQRHEEAVVCADGLAREVIFHKAAFTNPDGEVGGIIGVILDITERKQAEALQREREHLKDAVRAMEQVLGVVGHELRTPLAGLRAISEFLLEEEARQMADWDRFLRSMHDEIVRMTETVNDLLEAARMNSGRMQWNWSRFSLRRVCEEAMETVGPLVDRERVELTVDVAPEDAEMSGDMDAVRRMLVNLLSNARKHTQRGSIRIEARMSSEEDEDWAIVHVRDTGGGISPDIADRLGEAFALNSGVVGANHVGGAGLGLAICKGIVAAHGGRLVVESSPGQGTTITARLRADLPDAVKGETVIQFVRCAVET